MNRGIRRAAASIAAAAFAAAAVFVGALRYSPVLATYRDVLLVLIGLSMPLIAWRLSPWRSEPHRTPYWVRMTRLAGFLAAIVALLVTSAVEAQFMTLRHRVLAASPQSLERLGRHLVVGMDDIREVRRLIELKAIAGIFLTRRNIGKRSTDEIRALTNELQELRAATGLPPLWITADQEGGLVQRLSPPLKRQPPLSRVMGMHPDPVSQERAVTAYAAEQARGLASLGVNVNFAPVADVDFGIKQSADSYTRISRRAISPNAGAVAQASAWYCRELVRHGVRCTRKHFPGLGRVHGDTHVKQATLAARISALRVADWLPFAAASRGPEDWIMLGHARVAELDPSMPASTSRIVVDVLRKDLGHRGIIITDDFSMGAIRKSPLGIAGAAVGALSAGVDLVLVSFDPDQIYTVLGGLLAALDEGSLDQAVLDRSAKRLAATLPIIPIIAVGQN